ncbi:hypothetical protein B0H12DRAFT_1046161 [Mycena haematopus]|nr:hypothetical protein B0H12DRAFT_1046161 [Mycena haematopus]
MPESQVIPLFAHEYEKYQRYYTRKYGRVPEGRLLLFPRTFAEGTREKPYTTLSVDTTEFQDGFTNPPPAFEMNEFDAARIKKNCKWKYLVDREQPKGPVHVTFRGKSLAFTAGPHILVIHFALEGNCRLIPIEDFNEIVSSCQPGSNANRAKAKRLRSFALPSRLVTPGSADTDRTINIHAAVVMEQKVLIVSDFSRMTRLHVISSTRVFSACDLKVNSELWTTRLWAAFPSGPDWMLEPEAALDNLDAWRASTVASMDTMPIFDCLLKTDGPAAGVGAHLANDILFLLVIHPDTPANILCEDAEMYASLREFLLRFMAQWISDGFKRRCGGTANSVNSFDFNYESHTNFLASYVHCFRREWARVDRELYNKYQARGYLDEDHVIGTTYDKPGIPLKVSFRNVNVIHDGKKRYHIIRANTPSFWRQSAAHIPFADVGTAGYQTTVGIASFREVLSNKVNIEEALQNLRPGRPKKVRTKQVGRPRKATTRKKLEKMQNSIGRRRRVAEKENVMEMD